MPTEKSFWLPKLPCLYGFFIVPFHFLMALYPEPTLAYWKVNILLTLPYILMNLALAVYLCRFCERGAEPLWFASIHWGLIFLSGLAALPVLLAGGGGSGQFLIFLFYFLTAPLYPFYALFPAAGPAAACVYAGALAFFFLRGLCRRRRSR